MEKTNKTGTMPWMLISMFDIGISTVVYNDDSHIEDQKRFCYQGAEKEMRLGFAKMIARHKRGNMSREELELVCMQMECYYSMPDNVYQVFLELTKENGIKNWF